MNRKRDMFIVSGSAALVAGAGMRAAFADVQTVELHSPTTLPFVIFRGRVHLTATIDGQELNFFFDAGGSSSLTPAAAEKLGLAISGEGTNRRVRVAELRLGEAVWRDQSFPVAPIPLASPDARIFGGIIGREYFAALPLTIDYDKNIITLIPAGSFRPPAGQAAVPVRIADSGLLMDIVLDGVRIAGTIETAVAVPLTVSNAFAQAHGLPDAYPGKLHSSVPYNGALTPGYVARARVVQVGDQRLNDLLFVITGPSPIPLVAGSPEAIVGLGFFRRFTMTFDLAHGRAFLARSSHFDEPSPYNRTGMTVGVVNGEVQITDLVPAGGAAQAGAALGDRILTVNGLAPSPATNDAIVASLVGPVGSILTVRIARGGVERDLAIRLRDLV
jgi:hypothetical protein